MVIALLCSYYTICIAFLNTSQLNRDEKANVSELFSTTCYTDDKIHPRRHVHLLTYLLDTIFPLQ